MKPAYPNVDRLIWWGSECHDCGNATPASMRCDECQSTKHTTPMWCEKL